MSDRSRPTVLFLTALVLFATACASSGRDGADLATRLASGDRSAADKARDAGRRPAVVLDFMGVRPGMTVMDLLAAGGYYTEVLSEAVGPEGTVYAQNVAVVLQMRDGANDKALTARLADNRLPNVQRLDREFDDLGLAPGSIDVVFTALNLHDIIDSRGPEVTAAVLATVRETLAPDGILAIVDHAGLPGEDAQNAKLHRIDEARVRATLEAAGFAVEASSDALRNPDDDRTTMVFAPGIRGRTDRFVLRARKSD